MQLSHNPTIISAGIGGHYGYGVDRLERSLIFNGWPGRIMTWKDYPEGSAQHKGDGQYNFKPHCFDRAIAAGAKVALWCDASLWAVKNPMPIFDYIMDNGLFFFKTGYSLAETATDRLCEFAGVKREELMDVPEFATGLVGIRLDCEKGQTFFREWKRYMQAGMFGGNRLHDKADSEHPVFKFSRQDQSACSMVLHKMGIKAAGEDMDFISYYGTAYSESQLIFFIQGIG